MGKFEKAAPDDSLGALKFADLELDALPGEDTLMFFVNTLDRGVIKLDLTRFRDGNSRLGYLGFPELIMDLLPTIKKECQQKLRTKSVLLNWVNSRLSVLFKALTELKRQVGIAPGRVDDFENADGTIIKYYIMGLPDKALTRKKRYTKIYSLIIAARSSSAPPLRWPSFEIEAERTVHVDVDPEAIKALYHTCKRVVERAELAFKRGQMLLSEGVDPRSRGATRVWEAVHRGGFKNSDWHNEANLTVLERAVIKNRIVGLEVTDQKTIIKIHNMTKSGASSSGIRLAELLAASTTSIEEMTAAILIVSMETGWIDTVWGIDLTEKWYTLRRGDMIESLGKTDSVLLHAFQQKAELHAVRPKTSKTQTAIGLAGSRFRSFQLISGIVERSNFLRDCLRDRRSLLEGQASTAKIRSELIEIERRLRSPWLFYNSKGEGAAAVGLMNAGSINRSLVTLKKWAVKSLSPAQSLNLRLLAAIERLKWSDTRDAFASYIYENSGGNIFIVKRALGHAKIATTRSYLRQRHQIRQRFEAFRKIMNTALTEVDQGRVVDTTILFLASNYRDFSDLDRERLASFRTRMGMGCINPKEPDKHLAPNHIYGTICGVQRCVLCRHGIIFNDAYTGLADRHADLLWLRSNIPPDRWLTSSLSLELEAIELVRDNIFADRSMDFNMRSGRRLTEIDDGRTYVFDDPELAGMLH